MLQVTGHIALSPLDAKALRPGHRWTLRNTGGSCRWWILTLDERIVQRSEVLTRTVLVGFPEFEGETSRVGVFIGWLFNSFFTHP